MTEELKIVERRLVANGSVGRAEWQLREDKDGTTNWFPAFVNSDDSLMEPPPAWLPLPGSQWLFLECPIFEALYEGSRGGGKTLVLLMDFAREVGKGFGANWRGILFRKEYKDLDDVVKKLEEWMPRLFPGWNFLHSKSEYKAIWPTGEALLIRHLEKEEDYANYHGHEYPWLGFEELTQWEDDKPYKKMQSCCRSTIPGIPFRIRATTNPYGAGHNWVKKRFQLPHMRGKVVRDPGQMPRVAIHGSIHENFLLLHTQPHYLTILRQSTSSVAEAKAWMDGDWDVSAGGIFDDLWDNAVHVIPTFGPGKIPRGWTITRSYDHGQTHPFACLWWLESNGEPFTFEGKIIGPVRGDLILWMEWYGSTGEDNVGLKMPARKIARGIMDRENDEGVHRRVRPGPADSEIFNKSSDRQGRCPADDMEDEGILWERADKSPGSRKRGFEMGRTLLQDAKPPADRYREHPGLFICDRCVKWLELVPSAPRDTENPDDVPEKYEDHLIDASRYRWNFEVPRVWASGF